MADSVQFGAFIKEIRDTFRRDESTQAQIADALVGIKNSISEQSRLFDGLMGVSKESLKFQQEAERDAKRERNLRGTKDKEDTSNLGAIGMLSSDLDELSKSLTSLSESLKKTGDGFSTILTPSLLAFGAWMFDVDSYLRAIRPDFILTPTTLITDQLERFRVSLVDAVKGVSEIKWPEIEIKWNMPVVRWLDNTGKAIMDVIDYQIRLPVINFIDNAGKAIMDVIDYQIRLPAMQFVDRFGSLVSGDLKLQIPETVSTYINSVQNFLTGFGNMLRTAASWVLPDMTIRFPDMTEFMDSVKAFVGVAADGMQGGSGILGMFSGSKNFISPILRPLAAVTRIVAGPWIQGFLSQLDFVKGFADGFADTQVVNELGELETLSFADRVLNGLQGGIVGVVNGIVAAFDALFFKIPAWILEKLGVDEETTDYIAGLNIADMIDPVWKWVKNIPSMLVDLLPTAEDLKEFLRGLIPARLQGLFFDDVPVVTGPPPEELGAASFVPSEFTGFETEPTTSPQSTAILTEVQQETRDMRLERLNNSRSDIDLQAATAAYLAAIQAAGPAGGSTSINNNQVYNQQKIVTTMTDPARALRAFPGGF